MSCSAIFNVTHAPSAVKPIIMVDLYLPVSPSSFKALSLLNGQARAESDSASLSRFPFAGNAGCGGKRASRDVNASLHASSGLRSFSKIFTFSSLVPEKSNRSITSRSHFTLPTSIKMARRSAGASWTPVMYALHKVAILSAIWTTAITLVTALKGSIAPEAVVGILRSNAFSDEALAEGSQGWIRAAGAQRNG